MFSESTASYTANHVPSMEQIRPDPNGVGAGPRPALPGLRFYTFRSICPRQMVSFCVRRMGPCCWRAAGPAAPTVGAGNSGDTPLGRAAGCAAPTGSHWFRRFPPSSSSLFPLHSSLFSQYAPLCCSTTPNVLHKSMISSQTPQLRTYQESIWTRSS